MSIKLRVEVMAPLQYEFRRLKNPVIPKVRPSGT